MNGNLIDSERHPGKWNISTIRSIHMTNHLNPCVTTRKAPETYIHNVQKYKRGELSVDHPLSIWFHIKNELLFQFPIFESAFTPSFFSPSTYCPLLESPWEEMKVLIRYLLY